MQPEKKPLPFESGVTQVGIYVFKRSWNVQGTFGSCSGHNEIRPGESAGKFRGAGDQ